VTDDRALLDFAEDYIDCAGGDPAGKCYTCSWNIRDIYGIPLVEGTYGGICHTWNVMPDGRIFDGTHGQFDGGGPRFLPADAPGFTPKG